MLRSPKLLGRLLLLGLSARVQGVLPLMTVQGSSRGLVRDVRLRLLYQLGHTISIVQFPNSALQHNI